MPAIFPDSQLWERSLGGGEEACAQGIVGCQLLSERGAQHPAEVLTSEQHPCYELRCTLWQPVPLPQPVGYWSSIGPKWGERFYTGLSLCSIWHRDNGQVLWLTLGIGVMQSLQDWHWKPQICCSQSCVLFRKQLARLKSSYIISVACALVQVMPNRNGLSYACMRGIL